MKSLVAVWRGRGRRVKVALIALPAFCLVGAGTAIATGFFGGNSLNPDPQDAAKIVGIEQLVANYTNDVDWGPISAAPNGISDPDTVGSLFTAKGNFAVLFWNDGHPVPLSWHPASGRSYDHCDNVGPAAVSRFFGGPGTSPRKAPFSHHQVTNLQIQLDRGGQTATVRGGMYISLGTTNSTKTGGTITPLWTGHYYGRVRLTPQGWRFDYWAPIVDQPIELAGCYANNENP
jgi:hypothetical protein